MDLGSLVSEMVRNDAKTIRFINNTLHPTRILNSRPLQQPLPSFGPSKPLSTIPFEGLSPPSLFQQPLSEGGRRGPGEALEKPWRGPGRVSLMKFSSTNPVGDKTQTFSSTNPFSGKKVTTSGLHSATPSEGTSAFNQPFRLKLVSPRRGPAKIEKWSC